MIKNLKKMESDWMQKKQNHIARLSLEEKQALIRRFFILPLILLAWLILLEM